MVGRCDDLVVMANKLELGKAQSYLLSGAPRNSLPSYPSFSVVALDTFSHCSGVFTEICFFHGNLIFFLAFNPLKGHWFTLFYCYVPFGFTHPTSVYFLDQFHLPTLILVHSSEILSVLEGIAER